MNKNQHNDKPILNLSVLSLVFILAFLFVECKKDENIPTVTFHNPLANPENGPAAGNPDGDYPVPADAGPEDVSTPDQVIGNGTPESCTCQAVVNAVARGGKLFLTVELNLLS